MKHKLYWAFTWCWDFGPKFTQPLFDWLRDLTYPYDRTDAL